MKSRTRAILLQSIQDFIETGNPVTSGRLYSFHDFGIKPAMLRIELGHLDDAGYLYQNHPSGGRYPTNKAYKYLVDHILEQEDLSSEIPSDIRRDIVNKLQKQQKDSLVREAASFLRTLGFLYEPSERFFYSGFEKLVDELEINDKEEFAQIARDFEMIPERLEGVDQQWYSESESPHVFVGENPITESKHLSVIVQNIGPDDRTLFVVVGPRRMDYRKSLGLFRVFRRG